MRGCLLLVANLLLAGGCRQLLGIDEASVAADAAPDAAPDVAIDAAGCLGVAPFEICVDPASLGSLTVTSTVLIDTDSNCPLVHTTADANWCVYPSTEMTIIGDIHAVGSRPLVLLATSRLALVTGGTVNVSSVAGMPGAAARVAPCATSRAGTNDFLGAGGGAGGSFANRGGNGGAGNTGAAVGGTVDAGLGAGSRLRGGCAGGRGGGGNGGASEISDGGGAIYLVSGGTLDLSGRIFASGAPGAGGSQRGGGSGGGSGGMVLLWARTVTVGSLAVIAANGAGGGGGGGNTLAGSEGSISNGNTAAMGGSSGEAGAGGNGGNGNRIDGQGEPGQLSMVGGGGGGGGAGLIRVLSGQTLAGAVTSPTPITSP